jgi:hypothetical protein
MNLPEKLRLLWLTPITAADRIFAQLEPAGPKLTPLPHPELPKPVEIVEVSPPWLFILCGAAAAILFAVVIWMLFRRQTRKAPPMVPPLTLAHRRLLDLLGEIEELDPAETGHRVSVILRDYQLGRYRVPAPFRTREELYDLHEFATDEERRGRFASIALTCDQLAFAPAPTTKAEAGSLVRSAIEALRHEVYHAEGSLQTADVQPGTAVNALDVPGPSAIPDVKSQLSGPSPP